MVLAEAVTETGGAGRSWSGGVVGGCVTSREADALRLRLGAVLRGEMGKSSPLGDVGLLWGRREMAGVIREEIDSVYPLGRLGDRGTVKVSADFLSVRVTTEPHFDRVGLGIQSRLLLGESSAGEM
jgi:hypothetical protein